MKRVRKELFLFHVQLPPNNKLSYDSFSEFIVAAESADDARNTYPNECYAVDEEWPIDPGVWVTKEEAHTLIVRLIGVADEAVEPGIVLSVFCPG